MPVVTKPARVFASDKQITNLARGLARLGVTDAKSYLEPRSYVVKGVNFGYREVQAALNVFLTQTAQGPSADFLAELAACKNIRQVRNLIRQYQSE